MKKSKKRKLKRIAALAMTLVLALTVYPAPMNVFAADTYKLTILCDDTVEKTTIKVVDDNNDQCESSSETETSKIYNITSGGKYKVTASPSLDYVTNYKVLEKEVSATADTRLTLSAVTKNDVSFTVSIDHATIKRVTVNGTSLTEQSGSKYTIPSGTSPKEEVIIYYMMDTGYTAATSWGSPGSYKTTVSKIVSTPTISLTGANLDAPQGTLKIQSADPNPVNGYYAKGTKVTALLELTNSVPNGCYVKYGTSESKDREPTSWHDTTGSKKNYTADLTVNKTTYCWFGFADTTTTKSMSPPLLIKVDNSGPSVTGTSMKGIAEADNIKWINGVKNAAIQITATDTESGLDKIEYYWSDTNSYTANSNAKSVAADNSSKNTFSIAYSEDGYNEDYLVFRVYDKLGNYYDGSYLLPDIKYDFTAPTLKVAFTDANEKELTTDEINKW